MTEINPELPPEPEAQPTPPPESEGWSPPTREEWETVGRAYLESQQARMQMASYIEQMQAQAEQAEPVEDYADDDEDFTIDSLKRLVAETVAESIQTNLNNHPVLQHQSELQGQQIANQLFDQVEQQTGAFNRDLAMSLAQAAYSRGMQANQAIQFGAQAAKHYTDAERQAAVKEYQDQLSARLTAPPEVPTQGAATERPGKPRSYDEVNDRFFARQKAEQALN